MTNLLKKEQKVNNDDITVQKAVIYVFLLINFIR